MKAITYKNSGDKVTIKDCMELYKKGICTTINDGEHITFIIEKEPTTDQVK